MSQLGNAHGFYLSSNRSFYIADTQNHRILLCLWNASTGTVIAGESGVPGNDTFHLNRPTDIVVDEKLGEMYVADFNNHRILKYTIGSSKGTIVAGGNGPGKQRKCIFEKKGSENFQYFCYSQLNNPIGVYVSKKRGALYIADHNNHRIQRWNPGDSQGVTIAGNPNGTSGTSSCLFKNPNSIVLDAGERYLFIADRNNHQIKMFELI